VSDTEQAILYLFFLFLSITCSREGRSRRDPRTTDNLSMHIQKKLGSPSQNSSLGRGAVCVRLNPDKAPPFWGGGALHNSLEAKVNANTEDVTHGTEGHDIDESEPVRITGGKARVLLGDLEAGIGGAVGSGGKAEATSGKAKGGHDDHGGVEGLRDDHGAATAGNGGLQ